MELNEVNSARSGMRMPETNAPFKPLVQSARLEAGGLRMAAT